MAMQMNLGSGCVNPASARRCSQPVPVPGALAPRSARVFRAGQQSANPSAPSHSASPLVARATVKDEGSGVPHIDGKEPSVDARTAPTQQVLDIWRNADAVCFDVSLQSGTGYRVKSDTSLLGLRVKSTSIPARAQVEALVAAC